LLQFRQRLSDDVFRLSHQADAANAACAGIAACAASTANAAKSGGHLAAGGGAAGAGLSTRFAVVHAVCATFFGTPFAHVCAQRADLFGKRAVACDRIGTESAERDAINATGRARVHAFLADHMREAVAASGTTVVTSADAI